ncbi:hypothetical protein DMB66_40885 [Actinoplanes sp. ATCC 53533]|nr:hypothetical protein DMB66_40885 [Actinoplanes sp. ATCC 53533]
MFAGVLLAVSLHGTAYADHDDSGTDPDNRNQGVLEVGLTPNGATATLHGKNQLERSVISTTWGSGDIETYDNTYGDTGWHGTTDCTNWNVLWTSCDIIRIRFNESQYKTVSQWRSLGCHEFGHSGDLGHRSSGNDGDNNSCMRVEIWPENYDQHDLDAIEDGV